MIGRITSSTMTQQSLRTLQTNLADRERLQNQAASQRAFRSPSEDPAAAATTLGVHGEQARVAQFARNLSDGMAWVTTVDTALGASTDLLNRARDLTAQGANSGALSPTARESIAQELETISAELLAQANTTVLGRSVFAGTGDAGAAFDPDTFAFHGSPGDGVQRRISDNETVRVDFDGSQAFGEGANSAFALLRDIAAELRSGANVGPRLDDIDARLKDVIAARGTTGARQVQIERAASQNLATSTDLEARRAEVENVDSLEVLVRLQSAELVFQSALQVTAKSLQTNLLEFLR
ncbi:MULTISPECIES: flagellar hook-associated protein FlgL [Microbacterium]|jgi:flagellar hook-associated protein 3 FlgL|uniref:Flagellar hook-associated protein FlgL n=1 Tax=Microbacterium galbinum TaxID=2851646 RepID=A0ABY4ISL3_9MICO|nr:flagellar hook-associated protein FlgL [Microbacterium galbinum]MBQ3359582.1 flagellar hook-associated protein FlgL [Microbacterium sp.]MCK2028414.1 flagellar hook-associated protein FlgL [Microbacterium galbinum]UPL15781.1 flagellar hook-associated protein FlgL [Microbacterium galbinum]